MLDAWNPLVEKEAFTKVGTLLYRLLSEGDERIELTQSATAAVSSPEILAYNPDGQYATEAGPVNSVRGSAELWQALRELRSASYKEGLGTWFSTRITVTKDASATAEYNYDDEPDWDDVPIDPIAYVTDQEKFPRDEDKQPEWLKQRLAEGRARLATR